MREKYVMFSRRHENLTLVVFKIEDAAEREVFEEAGVRGRLGRLLGIFEVFEVNVNMLLLGCFCWGKKK
jgi:8-oxo-dGTP pyrophosphatase MutT (NUDIX family)